MVGMGPWEIDKDQKNVVWGRAADGTKSIVVRAEVNADIKIDEAGENASLAAGAVTGILNSAASTKLTPQTLADWIKSGNLAIAFQIFELLNKKIPGAAAGPVNLQQLLQVVRTYEPVTKPQGTQQNLGAAVQGPAAGGTVNPSAPQSASVVENEDSGSSWYFEAIKNQLDQK